VSGEILSSSCEELRKILLHPYIPWGESSVTVTQQPGLLGPATRATWSSNPGYLAQQPGLLGPQVDSTIVIFGFVNFPLSSSKRVNPLLFLVLFLVLFLELHPHTIYSGTNDLNLCRTGLNCVRAHLE
ncbi:unnamed protein product, partial [Laminaria digitata]